MPEAIKAIDVEALMLVRTVPDFPKPGILFYDLTTLLKDKTGFAKLIDLMAAHYLERKIDLVLGSRRARLTLWSARRSPIGCRGIRASAAARKLPAPAWRA